MVQILIMLLYTLVIIRPHAATVFQPTLVSGFSRRTRRLGWQTFREDFFDKRWLKDDDA